MSECDRLRVKKICEAGNRLLGKGSPGFGKDPRSLPADVQAELRRIAERLEPLLKRMADDADRRAEAKQQGT